MSVCNHKPAQTYLGKSFRDFGCENFTCTVIKKRDTERKWKESQREKKKEYILISASFSLQRSNMLRRRNIISAQIHRRYGLMVRNFAFIAKHFIVTI